MRLLVGLVAVAVQADPLRGGQRDVHVVVEQHDRIEAGAGLFLVVGVAARIPGTGILARAGAGGQLAGIRHDEDVTQVGDAGAAEVEMREPRQDVVGVVVARAPVPALVEVRRSDLHGAEGHVGANEHVAVPAGTDEGIDVPGEVFRPAWRSHRCHQGGEEARGEANTIHMVDPWR